MAAGSAVLNIYQTNPTYRNNQYEEAPFECCLPCVYTLAYGLPLELTLIMVVYVDNEAELGMVYQCRYAGKKQKGEGKRREKQKFNHLFIIVISVKVTIAIVYKQLLNLFV